MDKKTEALKLALDALEFYYDQHGEESDAKAITAIREALAEQPAQQQTCHSKTGKSETQSSLMLTDETQAQQQEKNT